jgi:hypothetical protein
MRSVLAAFLLWSSPAGACSIFAMSDGQNVLAGNNEDDGYVGPFRNAKVTFVPAGGEHLVGSMYYSFDDGYPQGGMNTAGLFYDINALAPSCPAKYPDGTPDFPGGPGAILLRMLDSVSTVRDALKLLHSYKLAGIEAGQIFVADRTGDAAVVGVGRDGTVVETRKKGDFLISTNFNLNNPTVNYPEPRFELANKLWREDPTVSTANVRRILSAIHFEGASSTLYSQVYDLKNGEAMVFLFHDYTNGVRIKLARELRKRGSVTVPIASLFDHQPYAMELTTSLMDALAKAGVKGAPDPEPSCK